MAIVRMVGNVDGNQIIFGKDGDGLWAASIPRDIDGEYIVDVTAYDEAGNEAYSASMLFIVDPYTLEVKMLPLTFTNVGVKENYYDTIERSDFVPIEIDSSFTYNDLPHNYSVEVMV